VRRFDDLHVGETVYSLGSPAGFDLSFGQGLIAGLRDIKGAHIIQNSAPSAPGSSGGGLFDARGNLIGITTFIVGGSGAGPAGIFSFSIAADDFWR
jgi:S1-C subfamily serine protease